MQTCVSDIEIDAFDGHPENDKILDMLMTNEREWMGNPFTKHARAQLVHMLGQDRGEYFNFINPWAQEQARHGEIEISVRSGGGLQAELLPKGGFITDRVNASDAFVIAYCSS